MDFQPLKDFMNHLISWRIPEYKDICINTPDGKVKAKTP